MNLKELVKKWFEKWEEGDFHELPISKNFKHTSPFGTINGKKEYLDVVEANKDKFLGYRFEIHDEIYDEDAAKIMGITHRKQVMVMIHSGSRGLGHQVCSEYIKTMTHAMRKYNIDVPDRELCSAPTTSPEGQSYLGAMSAAANYAFANRQVIMHKVRECFSEIFKK